MFLIGQTLRLSFAPAGGYWLVVPLAAILLALVWLVPLGDHVPRGRRRVLSGLRLGVLALLILAMLRPTLVWSRIARQPATLIVLADRSRSMLVEDAVGNQSRWAAVRESLGRALPELIGLAEDLEVKLYTFDAEPQAVELSAGGLELGEKPEGQQTALGAVLDDLIKREAGKRLAGVILLSDGAQRAVAPRDMPPQLVARRMADLGYRLYAVPFGQARGPGQARDVALEELLASGTVFVKNQLQVAGVARVDGYVNQDVQVQLLVEKSPGKMEPVDTARVQARQDGERLAIELDYVPQTAGEIKITLATPPRPGESVTTNNQISTFVTVLKGGLNVLYLNGSLLPEQKFLRWSLDASPDINVDYLFIQAQQPETRPADLMERFQPGKYDVYMIGDLDSKAFTSEELTQLAQTIERGAGLIMLGGVQSFGAGGYGQTPLADVLPIVIDRFERQNFDEPLREDLHLSGAVRMLPTQFGATQSLMLLAARGDANLNAWQSLAPLEGGANRFAGIKPGANVLAESEQGEPLLVARDYAAGRTIALAVDSTWHWWMQGHQPAHRRFWRQVVLWLARKDESTEGNVWIKLDQRRYMPGARVEFLAGAETAEGEPVADAEFEASVRLPDGTTVPLRLRRQGPEMLGSFTDTGAAGDYTLVVEARRGEETLGTARARFLVFEQDLELANPAADLGTLESLASITSGKSVAPEQLPALLAQIEQQSRRLEVRTETKRSLWDNWGFMLTFLTLLITEWFLRKKWGLV